ncbi:MAG: DUF4124 domain-containing protein [Gammaproteobacteria bacterium]
MLVILLLWARVPAADEIYRWSDEDGSITYSDQPPPPQADGGRIEPERLPRLQVVPAVTAPSKPPAPEPAADDLTKPYQLFSIVQPQGQSAVRANNGDLTVVLNVQPALWIAAGHKIQLYLDGQPAAQGAQTSFQLRNLDRGAHHIRAEILDRNGRPLISTDTVGFTLLRHSRLF